MTESEKNLRSEKRTLIWKKAGQWGMVSCIFFTIFGITFLILRIYLTPPLTPHSFSIYLMVVILTGLFTIISFIISRPATIKWILLALPVVGVGICLLLLIIGPVFIPDVHKCYQQESKIIVHFQCDCITPFGIRACDVDQLPPLPFIRITVLPLCDELCDLPSIDLNSK